ncbi:molybdopterin molybdotransferase MoeA [Helicobacter sp. 14348-15]|uniref:molybdopterin molybdotransferase MoeA n=1 Tax=Helicobacter colisuis TaxID=2949739 RepID=UPI00202AD563|nr:molybdopterin molybdotransferase MoeA [Helicobacter colisuis]MCL9821354.1 molybdopterin molybdotransferase MoeA [Helicobacter colisuis]
MQEKISYLQAKEILNSQNIYPKGIERVFLHESLNRILSQDIFAPNDMPMLNLSNMDGYAIYSAMLKNINECFEILQENPAGNKEILELPTNKPCAIKTFTGAAIPKNADILVPIEWAEIKGNHIIIKQIPKIGEFIRKKGDNYKKGEKLLSKGTKINSHHIGLLASLNQVFVEVYERPKVGILVNGNEILELGESKDSPNSIYNANGHLLYAKILENGGIPKLYPILKDDKEQIQSCLQTVLRECDLILSTGGASVGDYDFIRQISQQQKEQVVFRGVRIKPGQHVLYAHFGGKQFFGLPGFPNSTLVTFELFVKIILAKLCGSKPYQESIQITLDEDLQKNDSRLEFRVCNIRNQAGIFSVDFLGKKDFQSAILNNFCPLDNSRVGLAILENQTTKGKSIEVLLL